MGSHQVSCIGPRAPVTTRRPQRQRDIAWSAPPRGRTAGVHFKQPRSVDTSGRRVDPGTDFIAWRRSENPMGYAESACQTVMCAVCPVECRVRGVYDKVYAWQCDPAVLDPTVGLLAELADGGPVLEFAIGTGRVALSLSARGISVHAIELSRTWSSIYGRSQAQTPWG